ncbi:MAG: divalent-cation tolerance protein CutA [Planctomycetota bacterium]|jgi:periplasmic divalent cation tolerance protein
MSVTVTFVMCGSKEEGEKIARALVEEKLAACVNIVPGVTSVYFWEGKLNVDPEHLLVVKSTRAKCGDLVRRVRELHSYDVPEVITMPVSAGSPDYLKWVENSV